MTKQMSEKASAKLSAFFAMNNVTPLPPDELALARTDPTWGDGVEIGFEIVSPKKGRPKKGEKRAAVVGKTVKQTPAFWRALEAKALARGMTLHEAMRDALMKWLAVEEPGIVDTTAAPKERKREALRAR
jgi:hypothetical protein